MVCGRWCARRRGAAVRNAKPVVTDAMRVAFTAGAVAEVIEGSR